jgi:hypothetical protein
MDLPEVLAVQHTLAEEFAVAIRGREGCRFEEGVRQRFRTTS